jgi:Rha family phage regulatory protein
MNTLVMITDHRAITTSLIIANAFEKQHKNILRDIERLDCSEGFRRLNFEPAPYLDEQKKPRPAYNITRDGFSFLAMGFTGPKAARFKEAFIAEFNRMEQELREPRPTTDKRVEINMNHKRGITNQHGMDIKYNLDLTKVIHQRDPLALTLLQRLTGVDLNDIIDELTGANRTPTPAPKPRDYPRHYPPCFNSHN